jgi:hypothetical protein
MKKSIIKMWWLGRHVRFDFIWKSSSEYLGRFGGGWQWKLGFQATNITRDYGWNLNVNLLICYVQLHICGRKSARPDKKD